MLSRVDFGLVTPVRNESVLGRATLRAIPPLLLAPAVVGWLRLQCESHGLFGHDLGEVVFTMMRTTVLAALIWVVANSLHKADRQRKLVELQLAQHRAELAHVLRLNTMGEMAAGIAHELNQPLTAISNFASGIIRKVNNGSANQTNLVEASSLIAEESARAAAIIRSLNRFVKRREPQLEPLDVNEVVRGAIRILAGEAHQRRVTIHTSCVKDLPIVCGDRIQLEQVLVNLMCNGFDALQERSLPRLLNVETRRHPSDAIEVIVADNGFGLPAESNIFEPFVSTKPHGLGMGLAISRSIVESHGGRLWAESTTSGGATFRFTIPCENEPNDER